MQFEWVSLGNEWSLKVFDYEALVKYDAIDDLYAAKINRLGIRSSIFNLEDAMRMVETTIADDVQLRINMAKSEIALLGG